MAHPNGSIGRYLRFLELAEELARDSGLPPLTPQEEQLLQYIAMASDRGERLAVRDVMAKRYFGAPATVFNRLRSLRSKGWVQLDETDDSRRKQVGLTQDAWKHFERLSRCAIQAAKPAAVLRQRAAALRSRS